MISELELVFALFCRRTSVHPAGAVTVMVDGRTAMPATMRSPPKVPAGTLIVMLAAVPFMAVDEAARNAIAAEAGDEAVTTNPAVTSPRARRLRSMRVMNGKGNARGNDPEPT